MRIVLAAICATVIWGATAHAAPSFLGNPGVSNRSGDALTIMEKRRKPRVPGGSGCDDPEDRAEHPECRKPPKK